MRSPRSSKDLDAACDHIIFCVWAGGCAPAQDGSTRAPGAARERTGEEKVAERGKERGGGEGGRERTREEEKASRLDCCCVLMSHRPCCWRRMNRPGETHRISAPQR